MSWISSSSSCNHVSAVDLSVITKHIDNTLEKFRSKDLQDIDDAKKLYGCVADGSAPTTIEDVCGFLNDIIETITKELEDRSDADNVQD